MFAILLQVQSCKRVMLEFFAKSLYTAGKYWLSLAATVRDVTLAPLANFS